MGVFTTHLILEERVPDLLRHFRHSQNVPLTFFVPLGTDTIVECEAVILDQPEGAGSELAQSRVGIKCNHLLEQFCPSFRLIAAPNRIITIL